MTRSVLHDALWLVLPGMMLLGLAGCPSSDRQPAAEKRRPAAANPAAADQPAAAAKLPAAESQPPLLLPPSEPLPKLADEPAARPAAERPPAAVGGGAGRAARRPPRSGVGRAVAQRRWEVRGRNCATGKHSGVPFDPIKENGPIFVDWPKKPKVAIVITGMEEGYIEPCGCAGLDFMKGGMGRRCCVHRRAPQTGLAPGRARRGRAGPRLRPPGRAEVPNHHGRQAEDGLRRRRLRHDRPPAARRLAGLRGRRAQPVRLGQRRAVRPRRRDHSARPASSRPAE